MFQINTRRVPARRVMSIQRRLNGHETDGFVRAAKAAFIEHLDGAQATGPFTLIFHGPVNADEIRTEPAHDEAYTTVNQGQWDYPAILAAYDAVACSSEVAARPNSQLSCREVYVAEPDAIEMNQPVCDVAYPLAEPNADG